jgi:hypothetical protein
LRNQGNALEGRLMGEGEADFYPESQTKFFAKAASIHLIFELDEKGDPAHVIIDYMGKKMRAEKIVE